MNLINFITRQMEEHTKFVSAFRKYQNTSNDYCHPDVKGLIKGIKRQELIREDAATRAAAIIKKGFAKS
jgi:hypothetical protein